MSNEAKLAKREKQIRKMRKALNACLRTDYIYRTDQVTGETPYTLIVEALKPVRLSPPDSVTR